MAAAGRRWPSDAVWIVAGLTIVGLALRLPSFGDSFFGDEMSTNFVVNGFGVGGVIHILQTDQEGTPPLFFLLTSLTKGIGGVEGLRTISLLAGVGAIPLTYLLGSRTVGPGPGFVGAALVALSPFQIFYATEARAYALMMFFCLLAALALVITIDSDGRRWWVVYGLSVAAAAYTHYTSVFLLLGVFAWAFIARPKVRVPLILSNLGAALLFLPWLPELIDDRHEPAASNIDLLHPFTYENAKDDLTHLIFGHPYLPVRLLPGTLALWLMAAGAAAGVIALVLRARQRSGESWWPMSGGLVFVLVLALAAPVGAAVQTLGAPSVFSSRNLISCWPGLALAAGVLVASGSKPWRYAATALLVGGVAIGGVKMLDDENQRADYRGMAEYIEGSGPASAPVVDAIPFTPGPQTGVEAALAPKGEASPPGRPVFALTFPTLEDRLAAVRPGGSILDAPRTTTEKEYARQAVRAAGDGPIFLVTGPGALDQLRASTDFLAAPLARFLNALPPRFHEVESHSFGGALSAGATVHVLQP